MDAKLIVVGGKANKAEVPLKLPTVIGRGRDADLTVAHPTVSRHHCVLFEQDGVLFVRDNGSLNGTLIDGNKVQEAQLMPGETLTVGPLTFRADYELAGELPSASRAPAKDHLAETVGPEIGASHETVGLQDAEAADADAPSAAESGAARGSDDAPSFGFLSEERAGAEDEDTPAVSFADPKVPHDDSGSDVLDFIADEAPAPATDDSDDTVRFEPAAAAEPEEFALAPIDKKPSEKPVPAKKKAAAAPEKSMPATAGKTKPASLDDDVLAMLGGGNEQVAKGDEPQTAEAAAPTIKVNDATSGKAAAAPAAADEDLNDFFQSLGMQ